ncbi:uncharacterized protein LOC113218015 [Frankliniella occidentalis]|uniref:Uncharacterized protein LOC113218015 n=1 Tax=Frankliniella occidentalis TaxID=133901 RepID=A0A9C6XU59_FRAOC|nr:uncharacterized protein LOC113218015 [Frankliniella occidentalis]
MLCDDGTVTVKRIPADGHCLYRAVLHQRLPPDRRDQIPDDDAVAELRREVAGFMRKNRSTLQHFYTADKRQDLDHSIDLVEDGGWGDHISLYAVANLWSSPIEVLMEYGPKMVHYPDGQDTIGTSPSAPPPTLRLAYRCAPDADGQMVYVHYDSVVEVDGQQPAASAPSTAAPPPSTAAPSATPPRSACSTSSRGSRAPRRPHSPPATRSPRKRLCPAATETSATSGPSQSSQELVDPPSPTPGVLAPGSPNADCMSASQPSQPSQDTDAQVAAADDDDDAQATIDERVATVDHGAQTSVSERVVEDLAAQVYEDDDDAQGTVVDDMEGLVTTAFSPVRPISPVSFGGKSAPRNRLLSPESSSGFLTLVPELTSAQRASEWVWSQTLSDVPVDDDEANDLPLVDERLDPNRQDAATGVSTIFGILTDWQYQSVAATQPSKKDNRSLHPVAKTRTVSTNVVLSSGTLVGTFQVFDT